MTTLWDTTGADIVKALAEQRRIGGAVFSGMALTLVVIADEGKVVEAEQAAAAAAAQHPCRILVVVRRQIDAPIPRLDAEVLIRGRLGPGEAVVMRMYGRLGLHAESVVVPLLAADVPVVSWWHGAPPQRLATDALAVTADRRITDCSLAADPLAALRERADDYAPGDTDLVWTRSTPWRAVLTSTLDAVAARRADPFRLIGGRIEGDPAHPTAALLAGWLSARCGCAIEVVGFARIAGSTGVGAVSLDIGSGEQVRVQADHRGRAVISQPCRPDSTVALPARSLGELLREELRRLDPDEPYGQALEAATGRTGLSDRSPVRQYIWVDPAGDSNDDRGGRAASRRPSTPGVGDVPGLDEAGSMVAKSKDADPLHKGGHERPGQGVIES